MGIYGKESNTETKLESFFIDTIMENLELMFMIE